MLVWAEYLGKKWGPLEVYFFMLGGGGLYLCMCGGVGIRVK